MTAFALLWVLRVALIARAARALAPSTPTSLLKLVNPSNPEAVEYLPAGMARAFPTWTLLGTTFERVPDDEGMPDPVSFDEIRLAAELPVPTTRFAVGLHLRDGTVRHVMPAVDQFVRVFGAGGATDYRNLGRATVARARTWLAVGPALNLDALRLSAYVDDRPMLESVHVKAAVEKAVAALADEPPDALASGSHVVHVAVADTLDDDDDDDVASPAGPRRRRLITEVPVHRFYPLWRRDDQAQDAMRLRLTLEDALLGPTAAGELDVSIWRVGAPPRIVETDC